MPEQQEMRRAPARPKKVEEINPQSDIRVRVTGTVLSLDDDSISLDDGTGSVEVFLEEDQMEDLEEGLRVRVLGRVLPTPDSFELQGEVVQDFSDVDPELYDKVKKVVNTNE
ncbi:MAG: OB-fold nucleic acid binding domain-containing protein [Candidatus Nanohaloarchaea archaeon]